MKMKVRLARRNWRKDFTANFCTDLPFTFSGRGTCGHISFISPKKIGLVAPSDANTTHPAGLYDRYGERGERGSVCTDLGYHEPAPVLAVREPAPFETSIGLCLGLGKLLQLQ